MRMAAAMLGMLVACSGSDDRSVAYDFGPYAVEPKQETTKNCVQISLHNEDYAYVNSVELTAGPGFHHSNWMFTPEHVFTGPDGTFPCDERGYQEVVAAAFGGVLFAQSTQAQHEVQAFPAGVAIKVPPHTKIMAQLHLLNASDAALELRPTLRLTTIPKAEVSTVLAGMSFENQALALPARRQSRFVTECDVAKPHQDALGRAPDFHIYYALAHYHELGTGLAIEAVRDDGTASTIFSTEHRIGDSLGGAIDPPFDMTGYAKLRLSCDFYNPRADVVRWGIGDQEMCVFLAFSDSSYLWSGGVLKRGDPQNETQVGNVLRYSNACTTFAIDGTR
jgi:hypothetical protein